jgi:predicted membrane channel-forming protein YqfA (hemolysin III family)
MWGSTVPCVYYGFYCTPSLQRTYYSLVSVLAAGCVYATLHPAFRRPKYRPYRAVMHVGLGLSFIIPIVHGIAKFGWETQMWRMSPDWMALMTTFNLTSGALYAMRVRKSGGVRGQGKLTRPRSPRKGTPTASMSGVRATRSCTVSSYMPVSHIYSGRCGHSTTYTGMKTSAQVD